MKNKEVKPLLVKPSNIKSLKDKLIAAVHKVLNENKAELTFKIEKLVKKSIKRIVKKTDNQIKKALKTKQ
jgi:hypothetical protein